MRRHVSTIFGTKKLQITFKNKVSSVYIATALFPQCDCYRTSHIYHYMRLKIVNMDRELSTDAFMKIESVQHLRLKYSKHKIYHVGELVYLVRKKTAQMMRVYFRVVKDFASKDYFNLLDDLMRLKKLGADIQHSTIALYNFNSDDEYHIKHDLKPFRRSANLRECLEAAEGELRTMVEARNEAVARAYPATSTLVPDVFQKLKMVTHNWTELVVNDTKGQEFNMYDPELILL